MPTSQSCQTARSSLAATKALHREFAAAYALAIKTRDRADVERARELKTSLDAAMLEFAEANKILSVPRLAPNIFANWPSCLETIRVTELNKEFTRESLGIGGKSKLELNDLLDRRGIRVIDSAKFMMDSPEFIILREPEQVDLIRLQVADLGLSSTPTTDQIFARAIELGLELCPSEVGPQLRLQYLNQPMNEYVTIGMQQIAGLGGDLAVFDVGRDSDDLWLDGGWAGPGRQWFADDQLVFRLRKEA